MTVVIMKGGILKYTIRKKSAVIMNRGVLIDLMGCSNNETDSVEISSKKKWDGDAET